MLLYDIAEGADSFIWNGHTSVSCNSRFTVMDTHALQETGDNVKRTQYFNILTYDWEQNGFISSSTYWSTNLIIWGKAADDRKHEKSRKKSINS